MKGMKKLQNIIKDWYDFGKPFNKMSLEEMRTLEDVYYSLKRDERIYFFSDAVAKSLKKIGMTVNMDNDRINYYVGE